MRIAIYAALALTLVLPGAAVAQSPAGETATCKGSLNGDYLLTTVEFPDGYEIHGPWRVADNETTVERNGESGLKVALVLEGIIEIDAVTRERAILPLPEPVETLIEGTDFDEIIASATRVWCVAILNAHQSKAPPANAAPVTPARVRAG